MWWSFEQRTNSILSASKRDNRLAFPLSFLLSQSWSSRSVITFSHSISMNILSIIVGSGILTVISIDVYQVFVSNSSQGYKSSRYRKRMSLNLINLANVWALFDFPLCHSHFNFLIFFFSDVPRKAYHPFEIDENRLDYN